MHRNFCHDCCSSLSSSSASAEAPAVHLVYLGTCKVLGVGPRGGMLILHCLCKRETDYTRIS